MIDVFVMFFSYCENTPQQKIADAKIHIRANALFFNLINTSKTKCNKRTCFKNWRDKPVFKTHPHRQLICCRCQKALTSGKI